MVVTMKERLNLIWYRGRSRTLTVNLVVGSVAAFVAVYVVYSIASNLFDFEFLFGPYGSPDRTSVIAALEIEASDPRWLGMLKGAGNTIAVVIFAIVLSSFVGLAVGVARLAGNPIVTRIGKLYVETFRNIPLLLIMFFFAFGAFRELPKIKEAAGLDRVFLISNRGVAIPWLEGANGFWWVWVVVLVLAFVVAIWVRRKREQLEVLTGESTNGNTWGAAVFAVIAVASYAALLFPVRVTLPGVEQASSGFFTYEGETTWGWGTSARWWP